MGAVALVTEPVLESVVGMSNTLREAIVVASAALLGGAVYVGLAALLRLDELAWMAGMVRRRLGR
jgi:hypothetical protein